MFLATFCFSNVRSPTQNNTHMCAPEISIVYSLVFITQDYLGATNEYSREITSLTFQADVLFQNRDASILNKKWENFPPTSIGSFEIGLEDFQDFGSLLK